MLKSSFHRVVWLVDRDRNVFVRRRLLGRKKGLRCRKPLLEKNKARSGKRWTAWSKKWWAATPVDEITHYLLNPPADARMASSGAVSVCVFFGRQASRTNAVSRQSKAIWWQIFKGFELHTNAKVGTEFTWSWFPNQCPIVPGSCSILFNLVVFFVLQMTEQTKRMLSSLHDERNRNVITRYLCFLCNCSLNPDALSRV